MTVKIVPIEPNKVYSDNAMLGYVTVCSEVLGIFYVLLGSMYALYSSVRWFDEPSADSPTCVQSLKMQVCGIFWPSFPNGANKTTMISEVLRA